MGLKLIGKQQMESRFIQKEEASSGVIPFMPNPGSQSKLFFDLLGYKRGRSKKFDMDFSLYPDWMIEEMKTYGHFGDEPIDIVYEAIPQNTEHSIDFICYTAGNGAGKTFTGGFFLYSRSVLTPDTRGLIMANSYPQLRDSTLVGIAEFCQQYNIPLSIDKGSNSLLELPVEEAAKKIADAQRCRINGKFHFVRSAEAFKGGTQKSLQGGRGIGRITDILWDEALRWADGMAFDAVLTRLRGKSDVKPLGLITSTLNTDKGVGGWDDLIFNSPDRSEEAKRRYVEINGLTHENPYNDVDYVPRMKYAYTDELYKLEVLGIRINVTEGKIFKYFSRGSHCIDLVYDLRHPIHLSLDFNHDPSTAIVAQFISGELLIIKEFFLRNSNTFEMGDALASYLRGLNPTKVYLHGDASGNQKTANSKQSNWQIINDALKEFKPIRKYGNANPNVQDTINSVNCAFNPKNILFLDPSCKELIKDLESLRYDSSGGIDKKTDLLRSHLCDCFRYLVHDLIPYGTPLSFAIGGSKSSH